MKNKKKNNIIAKALLLPIIIANLNTNVFAINQNNNLNNYTRETEYKADTWYYDFTPMPTPRLSVGAVTVGTKIYTIGGYNNNGVTDTVEVYDTLTDSWSTRAPMPTARQNVKPVYSNGKIYVIGGAVDSNYYSSRVNTFEVYDIKKDTWESKASVPTQELIQGSVVFNDKIYTFSLGNYFFLYNEESDSWEEKCSTPYLKTHVNNQLKVIGDNLYIIQPSKPNEGFYKYDEDTDSWILVSIPVGAMMPANMFLPLNDSTVINNRLYMSIVTDSNMLEIFDVENNIRLISSSSSKSATEYTRMSAVGNKIYFMKGSDMYMYCTDQIAEPEEDIDSEVSSIDLIIGKVEDAEKSKDPADISNARDLVNNLPEGSTKDELQDRLDAISPNLTLDMKNATSNIDVYIKSENMLSLSLDTNSVTFTDFSGIEDTEKLNAINLTVNSSLPYKINAYLATEIQNSDNSRTMDKDILNIKANGESNYNTFADTATPIVLLDDQPGDNNVSHGIDLMLKGSIAHEKDIYKTVIKFEAEQK